MALLPYPNTPSPDSSRGYINIQVTASPPHNFSHNNCAQEGGNHFLSGPPSSSLVVATSKPTQSLETSSTSLASALAAPSHTSLPVFPEANREGQKEEGQQDPSGQERPHDAQEGSRERRGALPAAVRRRLRKAKGLRRKRTFLGTKTPHPAARIRATPHHA